MATTAFCNSAKVELMQATHCLNTAVTPTGNTHSNTFVDNVSSMSGVTIGMYVTGSGIPANTVIAQINSATTLTLSLAATTALTGTTLTISGDTLKMLLIKVGPSTTFSGTQTNVGTPGTAASSVTNVGTDETSGTGYTSGGTTLTNVTPTLVSTTAITNFSPNPNWTSASFSATAAIIYNASVRLGSTNGVAASASGSAVNRSISVHDFGGTQTVTSGTFTVVMPTADASNAILRIA